MTTFFATDYKTPPKNDNYTKLRVGETRLRALGLPIFGYVLWRDAKRICVKPDAKEDLNLKPGEEEKYFCTFAAWNYNTNKLEICEITKKTVIDELVALNKAKGSLFDYDVVIQRTGEGNSTRYKVIPMDTKPLEPSIVKKCDATPLYMDAMYVSKHPHQDMVGDRYRYYWEEKKTTQIDISGLKSMLEECHSSYQEDLKRTLVMMGISSIEMITPNIYDLLMPIVKQKREEHHHFLANEEKFVSQ